MGDPVAVEILLQAGDHGGDDLEGVGAHPRVRREDGHREHPGVGADVEEHLGVGAEIDHEVESEGVLGLGASSAAPVELLGDLAAEGLDEVEVGTADSASDLGERDRGGQTPDLEALDARRDRAQQGVEVGLGQSGLDRELEPEPGLSARCASPQVVVHDF